MRDADSVHNLSPTTVSYHAGVKAAMLRPPAFRTAFLLLLMLPFVTPVRRARAAVDPQVPASWVPQGFEALAQRAAFHTDFTFDRSMLQVANFFTGDDQDARNAIAKLNSITVHSYHFAAPGLYDPAGLDLVRRQYEAAGWRHLVAAHGKGDPFNAGQTDLWINFAHMNVTGMMVLFSSSKDLNLVALNGDLSPIDLLHLRGHFGIPRFSGDHFVPAPGGQARQPYVSANPAPDQAPSQYDGGAGVGIDGDAPGGVEAAPPPPNPPGF